MRLTDNAYSHSDVTTNTLTCSNKVSFCLTTKYMCIVKIETLAASATISGNSMAVISLRAGSELATSTTCRHFLVKSVHGEQI